MADAKQPPDPGAGGSGAPADAAGGDAAPAAAAARVRVTPGAAAKGPAATAPPRDPKQQADRGNDGDDTAGASDQGRRARRAPAPAGASPPRRVSSGSSGAGGASPPPATGSPRHAARPPAPPAPPPRSGPLACLSLEGSDGGPGPMMRRQFSAPAMLAPVQAGYQATQLSPGGCVYYAPVWAFQQVVYYSGDPVCVSPAGVAYPAWQGGGARLPPWAQRGEKPPRRRQSSSPPQNQQQQQQQQKQQGQQRQQPAPRAGAGGNGGAGGSGAAPPCEARASPSADPASGAPADGKPWAQPLAAGESSSLGSSSRTHSSSSGRCAGNGSNTPSSVLSGGGSGSPSGRGSPRGEALARGDSVSSELGCSSGDLSRLWSASPRGKQAPGATPADTPRRAARAPAPPAPPPGSENTSWAWLVEGILAQVVARLVGSPALASFRRACSHWRAVADHNTRRLVPATLKPRDMAALFPRLQVLELTHCTNVRNRDLLIVSDSGLRLRSLTIGDDALKPWVTNKGLASIGRMAWLRALALHDCNSVTNNGLARLLPLTGLTSLSLRGCRKITNNGLDMLKPNMGLVSLNLFGCRRISDRGLAGLAHLPLRALSLGHTHVKGCGAEFLCRLTQLTELHLTGEEMPDGPLATLGVLSGLEALSLRELRGATGGGIAALLAELPRVRALNVFGTAAFGDAELSEAVRLLPRLRDLDLRGTGVGAAALVEQLPRLAALTLLALAPREGGPTVGDVAAALAAAPPALAALAVSCGPEDVAAVAAAAARLPRLADLNVAGLEPCPRDDSPPPSPLTPRALSALAALSGLTSLDVSRRGGLGGGGLQALAAGLPRLAVLRAVGCADLGAGDLAGAASAAPRLVIHKRHHALDVTPEVIPVLGTLSAA